MVGWRARPSAPPVKPRAPENELGAAPQGEVTGAAEGAQGSLLSQQWDLS